MKRTEYWCFMLIIFTMSVVVGVESQVNNIADIFMLSMVAGISISLVSIPRLIDAGFSAWYALWGVVPGGVFFVMVMCIEPSKENKKVKPKEYKDESLKTESQDKSQVHSQANRLDENKEIQKSIPQVTNLENESPQKEGENNKNEAEAQEIAVREKVVDEQKEIQENEFNYFREKLIYDEYKKIYSEYKKLYKENKILKEELQKLKIEKNEN